MRRNMRFDGVPFVPVTVRRAEDRPRLVVLADVSLSVRATSRFTLHLVHGLQDLFTQVRSFVFVADVAETTELFRDHPSERALGLIFGGDVIDVDGQLRLRQRVRRVPRRALLGGDAPHHRARAR